MATELKMPQLGLTMEEGTVGQWLKQPGDPIKAGEAVVEITTDKLTNEVISEVDGVLLEIVAPEGTDVPVQGTLAYIGAPGEKAEAPASPAPAKAPKSSGSSKTVLVIGGGPGGYVAAIRAAQLGGKVTLVEDVHLGGTCLNEGCIPTKCLLKSADLANELRERGAVLGVNAAGVAVDMAQVRRHKRDVSGTLTQGVTGLLKVNGVKTVNGRASFLDAHTVSVKKPDDSSEELTADRIILAVGSVNATPSIPGITHTGCIDSTGALELAEVPASMVVIGGGVIGVELGFSFASFGAKVTILDIAPTLLPAMDGELTRLGMAYMEKRGVTFHLETAVQRIEPLEEGLRVICTGKDSAEAAFDCEKVLVAVGRKPNTGALGLERAGIAHENGSILVDAHMQTNVEGVFAVGDCVKGYAMLAGTASVMGEKAAENALGLDTVYDETTNPSLVHLGMDFASVGLTEEQAKAQGLAYRVGKFPLSANGKSIVLNGGEGMVKLLTGNTYGEVLGLHIIGPNASDLIAEGALAIRLEATAEELTETIHAHPTVTEAVREAALGTEKRAIHMVNRK